MVQDSFGSPGVRLRQWYFLAVLLVVMSIAGLLRVEEIGTISYWFDEASSWKTIQFSAAEMLGSIARNVHPPVFYLLLKCWAAAFGDGPVSLRGFSVTFGLLSVAAAYFFIAEAGKSACARPVVDAAALFGATLIALSPIHVALSQQARMYSLGTFLALTCATLLLRVCRTGGTLWEWLGCTITGTMLTLTHYYGLFTAGALALYFWSAALREAATAGASPKLRRMILGSFFAIAAAAAAWKFWLPVFLAQKGQVASYYWIPKFEWKQLPDLAAVLLSGYGLGADSKVTGPVAVGVWGIVPLAAFFARGPARLASLATVGPVAAAIAISINGQSILVWRYLVFAQTFLLLSWAILVSRVESRTVRTLLMCLSLVWFGFWAAKQWQMRNWMAQGCGHRSAAEVINRLRRPPDPVLVGRPQLHAVIQRYMEHPDSVFVIDRGYEYAHFEGGPILRRNEYMSLFHLNQGPWDRVFVVSSPNDVRLGPPWHEIFQQEFDERFGRPPRIMLHEFVRSPSNNQGSQ